MKKIFLASTLYALLLSIVTKIDAQQLTYPIVDTGQTTFYSNNAVMQIPRQGDAFFGQDAQYEGLQPNYIDNADGTITDKNTGLMWQQDMGEKITYEEAKEKAQKLQLGGYDDWRVATIKELYSLILFTGRVKGATPYALFIDTTYFRQPLGDTTKGERLIDAQTWSSTEYVSTTMRNNATVFGVNFIDGRIKGYPKYQPRSRNNILKKAYFRMVRSNVYYGQNKLVDNGDGTITDNATGLMWQQADDGQARDWSESLTYAENSTHAGYSDWRLPNAKELHSIVNYNRSPETTRSPAIDPLFECSVIDQSDGTTQYPYYWTSTTHKDGRNPYSSAVYIAFGKALGVMHEKMMDVHGAGAQRSDPKSGNKDDYPTFFGPQGDVRMVYNHVRLVRNIAP